MQKGLFGLSLTASKTTDDELDVGRVRFEESKRYRFVKNAESATTLSLGHVAFHKLSDAADMLKNVYLALTANLSVMAGVVMATDGIAAGSYGWVQTFGYNATISVSGATTGGTNIAAGDYLKGANGVSYAVRDAATQPAYRRNIQAITAVATTTTPAAAAIAGLINCE